MNLLQLSLMNCILTRVRLQADKLKRKQGVHNLHTDSMKFNSVEYIPSPLLLIVTS